MKVPDAFKILCRQEADKLIDHDKATQEALKRNGKKRYLFLLMKLMLWADIAAPDSAVVTMSGNRR